MKNRPVPSPNAYDFYLAASEAIVVDGHPEQCSVGCTCEDCDEEPRELTLEEKAAVIERNSAALQKLREGFAYEFLVPPDRNLQPTELGTTMVCRRLAKLLHMESEVLSAKGDSAGAMSALLDAVRMGSDLPRGGLIIDALVGRAVEAIGISHTWQIIDELDSQSARSLVRRAESLYYHHWPFAETMEDEGRLQHRQILEYFLGPYWKYVIAGIYSTHQGGWFAFIGTLMRLLPASREALLADHKRYMNAQIALARMPFAEAVRQPEVRGKLVRYYMDLEVRSEARACIDSGWVQKAFLAVALALRAYQLDHGAYPVELSDLVPDYLSAVPNDPFAEDAPLRYRIDGDRYILYSIGPDAVDDGGTAIFDPSGPWGPGSEHRVRPNSKGDIVAGVNW